MSAISIFAVSTLVMLLPAVALWLTRNRLRQRATLGDGQPPPSRKGSASGGSFIHVLGSVSSTGASQPGTIHADSDALGGCTGGSNQSIYLGKGTAGIVAFAAPLATNQTQADSTKPGQITSVAGSDGQPINLVRDLSTNVYNSSALGPSTAGSAAKAEPSGRSLVTRAPVDARYRAVARTAMEQASGVFTAGFTPLYARFPASVDACRPTQAQVVALNLTALSRLFVDCTTNSGFTGPASNLTISAGTVLFAGKVAPGATLSLPNAHHVYIAGHSGTGLGLAGVGASFRVNTTSNTLAGGACSTVRSNRKAVLFVKDGVIDQSNGTTLQLCKTTVFMMGGQPDGCVPTTDGALPTATPCNGTLGTGRLNQIGGDTDWTAPDEHDLMTLPNGDPNPAIAAAWTSPDGPEDLALWSESGSNSSQNFRMGGSGAFTVRGVFMVPNADSFTIGGNSSMTLPGAQFIASSIALNGTGTNITMSVDPNSAVTLPELHLVGLVR